LSTCDFTPNHVVGEMDVSPVTIMFRLNVGVGGGVAALEIVWLRAEVGEAPR
jgi:hypothetical protein